MTAHRINAGSASDMTVLRENIAKRSRDIRAATGKEKLPASVRRAYRALQFYGG